MPQRGLSSSLGKLACSCTQRPCARPPAVQRKQLGLALLSRASGRRGRPALRPPCAGEPLPTEPTFLDYIA
jgi:hypothetical protein